MSRTATVKSTLGRGADNTPAGVCVDGHTLMTAVFLNPIAVFTVNRFPDVRLKTIQRVYSKIEELVNRYRATGCEVYTDQDDAGLLFHAQMEVIRGSIIMPITMRSDDYSTLRLGFASVSSI